jgi:hypothetical protein
MVRPLAIGERADVDLILAGEWDDDAPDLRTAQAEEVGAK